MDTEIIRYEESRVSKDVTDKYLYPIFHSKLISYPFLTSVIRRQIIDQWQEIYPNVPEINLRVLLSTLEKKFYENVDVMDRNGLRNRIIEQQTYVNSMLIVSNEPDSKKARGISESNKVIASVGQLSNLAPSVEIKINTNINEDQLAVKMNTIQVDDNAQEPI